MSAASSASGANGFNIGSLSSALDEVSASIERAQMDSLISMFAGVKIAVKKIREKKEKEKRRPSKARKTPAEQAHELKMGHLQEQLRIETGAVDRAIRKLTLAMSRPRHDAANDAAIEAARAAVAASQQRLAYITSQINNPHTGMNANVVNNGRASIRHSMNRVSMRRGRSTSPRSMSPSSMGRNRNRNGNHSMGRSPSRSRSPKGKSMGRNRSGSPRRGGATRKRSTHKRSNK